MKEAYATMVRETTTRYATTEKEGLSMLICITATGDRLDAQVDPRFGRAGWFLFVESDSLGLKEAVENPNVNAMGGAGIQSAQMVAEKGGQVLLTGSLGPNAVTALSAAGIKVVTGVHGITCREAVERFRKGELEPQDASSISPGPAHSGGGKGRMGGFGTMPSSPGFSSREEEISALREEMEFIKGRVEYINRRLQELEKGE